MNISPLLWDGKHRTRAMKIIIIENTEKSLNDIFLLVKFCYISIFPIWIMFVNCITHQQYCARNKSSKPNKHFQTYHYQLMNESLWKSFKCFTIITFRTLLFCYFYIIVNHQSKSKILRGLIWCQILVVFKTENVTVYRVLDLSCHICCRSCNCSIT